MGQHGEGRLGCCSGKGSGLSQGITSLLPLFCTRTLNTFLWLGLINPHPNIYPVNSQGITARPGVGSPGQLILVHEEPENPRNCAFLNICCLTQSRGSDKASAFPAGFWGGLSARKRLENQDLTSRAGIDDLNPLWDSTSLLPLHFNSNVSLCLGWGKNTKYPKVQNLRSKPKGTRVTTTFQKAKKGK